MSHVTYFAFYDTFGKDSLTYLRALLVKWARSSSSGLYSVHIVTTRSSCFYPILTRHHPLVVTMHCLLIHLGYWVDGVD